MEVLQAGDEGVAVRGRGLVLLKFDGNTFGLRFPFGADFVIHLEGSSLVDGNNHGLPLVASVEEVVDEILRDGVEAVVARDEMVASAEEACELLFALFIQSSFVDDIVDFFVEVGVGDFEFRGSVLVEKGDGCAVFDGLAEVVDTDVVSEDLAGAFLPSDKGSAREGDELGLRQSRSHVHRERVILAAVGLVGEDDDVVALGENGVEGARICAELVDEGEDVAVVFGEETTEIVGAGGLAVALSCGRAGGEGAVDLIVQFGAVGDDYEGPVPRDFAEDFLGKEDHGEALSASLGVPEDSKATVAVVQGKFLEVFEGRDRGIDSKVLVVLCHDLGKATAGLGVAGEVLDEVEKAGLLAGAAQDGFQ